MIRIWVERCAHHRMLPTKKELRRRIAHVVGLRRCLCWHRRLPLHIFSCIVSCTSVDATGHSPWAIALKGHGTPPLFRISHEFRHATMRQHPMILHGLRRVDTTRRVRRASYRRADGWCSSVERNRVMLRRHGIDRNREPRRNGPWYRCKRGCWRRGCWQAHIGCHCVGRTGVRRSHSDRRIEQNAIHGSRRLRGVVGTGARNHIGKLVHDGGTVGEIPVVRVTWNPRTGEILLLERHHVPVYL